MLNLKKIAAAALAAAMALSLTACSGGEESSTAETYTGKAYEAEILTPGEIVVGVSADYPPYESLSTTGELEGFDIDMMEELATYMGTEDKPVKVVWQQMDFSTIITALQSGQIDLGVAAFTYNPERDACSAIPIWRASRWSCCRRALPLPASTSLRGSPSAPAWAPPVRRLPRSS